MGALPVTRDRDGFPRVVLTGDPLGVSRVTADTVLRVCPPPPTILCAIRSPTHLVTDAHFWCHDDLVSLAVDFRAPQELSLVCSDVVVAAMVAKLDALLGYQKHALCHILVCRFLRIAEELLCDFLCGQNTQRRDVGFCACSVGRREGLSRPRSSGV